MIKTRNNKAICLVMAFVFCLTFLAPAFVAPQAASASSTYTVLKTQTVSNTGDTLTNPKFSIDIPDMASLSAGDLVTVHLPSGLTIAGTNAVAYGDATSGTYRQWALGSAAPMVATADTATANADGIVVTAPSKEPGSDTTPNPMIAKYVVYPVNQHIFEIQMTAGSLSGEGLLYVELKNVTVTDSFDGDINATIVAPSGSGFSSGSITLASYIGSGQGTTSVTQSVKSMGDETTILDDFMIQESVIGAIKSNDVIKLKLPAGFKWVSDGTAVGAWGFTGRTFTSSTTSDERVLTITAPVAVAGMKGWVNGSTATDNLTISSEQGRVYLTGASIAVSDDTTAKKGDVSVSVSNKTGDGVTEQDVVVATYSDYSVTAEAVSSKDVVAGVDATELGSFRIAEGVKGSILSNRTITLTLPEGVKWNTNVTNGDWPANASDNPVTITTEKGSGLTGVTATGWTTSDNNRALKFTTGPDVSTTATSYLFKKLQATISADYTGDINITVAGTAGVTGTVKVATVVAPVTMTVASTNDIVIGSQAQKLGNISIKENQSDTILKTDSLGYDGKIILRLPTGATWYNKPTVTVTDGDLTIDNVSYNDSDVTITTKSESSTASTIELSDLAVTTDRTLPQGEFKVKIVGSTVDSNNAPSGTSTALTDNSYTDEFDVPTITSVVAGTCVTPASTEGTTGAIAGQFKINSNIYQVNGVSKVMDSTPYIKNARTYVPVRYLGYALGLTDDQIVWDATAQTATFTKGDTTVVLTIGSTTYTVNGESKTMDVAPEINNSRTMLPARFVAEAFGATVGWDASTGTIVLSN